MNNTSIVIKTKNYDRFYCSGCKEEKLIEFLIKGKENCYFCGNEIALCKECTIKLKNDLIEVTNEN